jgi:argininosuccinate lyase
MSVLTTSRQPSKSELLASFTNGVKPDQELFLQEIAVQKAWARSLVKVGVLQTTELSQILTALDEASVLMSNHQFEWREEDEDIHMNLERFVNDQTNGLGKKMHAGRSRNDLIATTLKLNVAESSSEVMDKIKLLLAAIINLAEQNKHVLIPGMTHLQNGQPIRWSHAMLGHAWALTRDLKKFEQVRTNALSVMPLGSAALAGTHLAIDLQMVANELGFADIPVNSYDSVGERDCIIDFLQAAAHLGVHLSRIAEDVIYWTSAPVDLLKLSADWSTGSSIMPNKRNPDVAELTRGKTALWMGDAHGVLTLIKGLPTCYASDLHETKIPYLRVKNDVTLTLSVLTPFITELRVNQPKAQSLLMQGQILATELANHLTEEGVSFRDAYAQVAQLVELAEGKQKQIHELTLEEIKVVAKAVSSAFIEQLTFQSTVEKRHHAGGTALIQIDSQIQRLKSLT